jgi:hypothetical protein
MIECVHNDEGAVVTVDGKHIKVSNFDSYAVWAECGLDDLGDETGIDFPSGLNIDIRSEEGFSIFPFDDVAVFEQDGRLLLEFVCQQPNEYWEGRGGLAMLLTAIGEQAKDHKYFCVADINLDDDRKRLALQTPVHPAIVLREGIAMAVAGLSGIIEDAQLAISNEACRVASMNAVKIGSYRHYKGNEYTVIGIARHSETQEELVVYRKEYDDHGLWVRPLGMFLENVEVNGQMVPRFQFLGPE